MGVADRREILRRNKEKQNQLAIEQAQEQLKLKKEERTELQQQLLLAGTDEEKRLYTIRLERNQNIINKISSRLKMLGVEEKRGRPKKEEGTRYQEQRKKFTAHLQPETFEYLQTLKTNGSISNISAFLDELVIEHKKRRGSSSVH